jgi:hypothetical protein
MIFLGTNYNMTQSSLTTQSQKLWRRWHRFDSNGVKYIRRFDIDETPSPLTEEGYTIWQKGTGPLSEVHYQNLSKALRDLSLGKPKSPQTKEKMRNAKLGKPKSEQHKKNMSLAQQKRFSNIKKKNEPNTIQQTGTSDTRSVYTN